MGLRAAINAKCKDCIYDPLSGLGYWRQQVGACTAKSCPFWPVRPLPTGTASKEANSVPPSGQPAKFEGHDAEGLAIYSNVDLS
jgi:hypothetical protein